MVEIKKAQEILNSSVSVFRTSIIICLSSNLFLNIQIFGIRYFWTGIRIPITKVKKLSQLPNLT
jgi:hypothetical protein